MYHTRSCVQTRKVVLSMYPLSNAPKGNGTGAKGS